MKKVVAIVAAGALALTLAGCGGGGSASAPAAQDQPKQEEKKAPLDLTGSWKQTNPNDPESYQEATIEGNAITVNWVSNGGDTKSLYWAGTYVAPTDPTDSYTWDSANDKEQTSKALLAAGGDTKTFTYDKGVLSYEASAMGTTTTVKMEQV